MRKGDVGKKMRFLFRDLNSVFKGLHINISNLSFTVTLEQQRSENAWRLSP